MIGILGGTFDPIHNGHLHIAKTLKQQLPCQEIRFIPCKSPLLGKKTIANTQQRLAMLRRALKPYPDFSIDEREIKRTTPSYTVDTLLSLRDQFHPTPLALIIGDDHLMQLNHWHKWTELIQIAHLVVVSRSDCPAKYNGTIQAFIKKHQAYDSSMLLERSAGLLFIAAVKPLAISSTTIREKIMQASLPIGLLPATVLNYIQEQKLYL